MINDVSFGDIYEDNQGHQWKVIGVEDEQVILIGTVSPKVKEVKLGSLQLFRKL